MRASRAPRAMALHAATIFLGAFLLFQLQPLMGKFLLPWFGGGPGVWTTCLLFFQGLLLAGYAYAHWLTTRLTLRRQALVHVGLLLASLAFLPVQPGDSWKPVGTGDPLARILLVLTATVGLPYFVLSATGPLLQRWASLGRGPASPYRLYALSNAGSLLALLSFPFGFEPLASRSTLSVAWSAGLVVFAGLGAACAWQLRKFEPAPLAGIAAPEGKHPGPSTPAATQDTESGSLVPVPGSSRALWVLLPAMASLLLAAVTNKVGQDIAAVPFLWVLPLAVYLLTFILCFDHPRWYSPRWHTALLATGSLATIYCLGHPQLNLAVQVGVYVATLFGGCMVAHGELHRLRPAPERLTAYYLAIAAGGALGSTAVAVLAPWLFSDFYELPIGLALLLNLVAGLCLLQRSAALAMGAATGLLAATVLVPALQAQTNLSVGGWFGSWAGVICGFFLDQAPALAAVVTILIITLRHGGRIDGREWRQRMAIVPLLLSLVVGQLFLVQLRLTGGTVFAAARNFYGAYKLRVYNDDTPASKFVLLSHGGTTHGLQFSNPPMNAWPTSYYAPTSGIGRILDETSGPPRHIGVVGLGAGSLAVYCRPGDRMRFYEIDPAIVRVAHTYFTYLHDAPGQVQIVPGDARLSLEAELRRGERQQFDVLALDAFSGDAIPVHLLTREAMTVYLQHLRPGGILAVHVSNRHLDLRPVVAALARHNGLFFASIDDRVSEQDWWLCHSRWILVTADASRLEPARLKTQALDPEDKTLRNVDWTDDHASMFSVLK